MKNLLTRRTIRQYSDKPVDDELLNGLMEAASRTQTMGNLQLYSVVVTRSQELKQQLAPAHFNQPMVTQALPPPFVIFRKWVELGKVYCN